MDKLYFCPKCKLNGLHGICKECQKISRRQVTNNYYEKNKEHIREVCLRRYKENHEIIRTQAREYSPKYKNKKALYRKKYRLNHGYKDVETLADSYIRRIIKNRNNITCSVEMIELFRQRIIMKRTLKQLNDWRKNNEPNDKRLDEKQRINDTVV